MSTALVSDPQIVDEPYPGLRSFRRDETHIFFGRESTINEMVKRLAAHRLLAVTGTSGSGKSSLVRTGLLDALDRGLMASAGADWRVADFRPGRSPLRSLADALLDATDSPKSEHEAVRVEALLARGPYGLVEWLNETDLSPKTNLLLLADQFEEIFRFRHGQSGDDINAFVALLLASAKQRERPIYVVITMRSDFLGECAQFSGLAEAVNDGQYLTTRLTRDQCQAAIEGPAAVFGGRVERALVSRLLNDMAINADQLPLAQHVLMRLWRRAAARTGDDARVLKLNDYVKLGGIGSLPPSEAGAAIEFAEGRAPNALSSHADEILAELTPDQQRLAAILFRTLTEGGGGRDVRRPVSLSEAANVADVEPEALKPVIEAFRAAGRNLLTPPPNIPLLPNTVIDISHESLIRQWITLRKWLREEYDAAQTYRHVETSAKLWAQGHAGLMTMPYLGIARAWRERERPNAAWASRYGDSFALSVQYLDRSLEAEEQRLAAEEAERLAEEREQKARLDTALRNRRTAIRLATAAVTLAIVAGVAMVFAYDRYETAEQQRSVANAQRIFAEQQQALAEERRLYAEKAEAAARLAAEREARARKEADKARTEAVFQRDRALTALSQKAFADGDYLKSMLLSVETLSDLPSDAQAAAPEALDLLARTYHQLAAQQSMIGRSRTRFMSFLSGGKQIVVIGASVSDIWDVDGKHVAQQTGHIGQISEYDVSRDGKLLVTAGTDGTVRIWEAATGQLRSMMFLPAAVLDVKFSSDDAQLVTGGADGAVRIIDVQSGSIREIIAFAEDRDPDRGPQDVQEVKRRPVDRSAGVTTAMLHPDGKHILTVWSNATMRVLDDTGRIVFRQDRVASDGSSDAIKTAMYTPDGSRIVVLGEFKDMAILDVAKNYAPVMPTYKSTHFWGTMAVSRDGRYVAVSGKYERPPVDVFDAQTGKKIATLPHSRTVDHLEFTPDGNRLITGSDDNIARVWDIRSGKVVADVKVSSLIQTVAVSPDGQRFATATADGVSFWDASTAKTRGQTLVSGAGGKAYLAPTGRDLLWATDNGAVTVWDVAKRSVSGILMENGAGVSSAAFSGDGKWIVLGLKDGRIGVWEANKLSRVGEFPLQATDLDFSPDGRMLVASVASTELSALDEGKSPRSIGAKEEVFDTRSVWITLDGRRLFTTGDGPASRLWNLETGELIKIVNEPTGRLATAWFHPDGKRLVTISQAGAVRILDADSGDEVAVLQTDSAGHSFSVPGHRLSTRSRSGVYQVWDTSTGRLLLSAPSKLDQFYFNEEGTRLIAWQGTAFEAFDVARGGRIATINYKTDRGIFHSFSADGSRVVIESYADASATVWSLETGRQIATVPKTWAELSNMYLRINADGTRIVVRQSDGPSRLYDATTGTALAVLEETPATSSGLSSDTIWSYDGERFVFFRSDGSVELWDGRAAKRLTQVQAPLKGFRPSIWWSQDSSLVIASTGGPVARMFNARTGDLLAEIKGGEDNLSFVNIAKDNRRVLAVARNGAAILWEVGRVEAVRQIRQASSGTSYYLSENAHRIVMIGRGSKLTNFETGAWRSMGAVDGRVSDERSFSPDGRHLAVIGGDNAVRVMELATGRVLSTLRGHTNRVTRAIFGPDGKRILTTSRDRTARLWDAATGKEVGRPITHGSEVVDGLFTPDGAQIVTMARLEGDQDGKSDQLVLWQSGGQRDLSNGQRVDTMMLSSNGNVLAAFSQAAVRHYDLRSGQLSQTITLQTGRQGRQEFLSAPFANLLYSADRSTVASERTGTVWAMPWTAEGYVDIVKALLPRCLKPDERKLLLGNPEPPDWCIEMRKWPYDGPEWKKWQAERAAGKAPEMPQGN